MLNKKQLRKIIFGAKNLNPGQLSEKHEHNHCATPTSAIVTSIYALKVQGKYWPALRFEPLTWLIFFSTLQPYGRSWFA